MAPIGTVAASQEYKELMQSILDRAVGQEPRKIALRCPETQLRAESSPFDRSFLDFLIAVTYLPQRFWYSYTGQRSVNIPKMHPIARLIQDEMRALSPFEDMAATTLSQLAIGIQIPSWLAGTEEACHIAIAAKSLFGPRVRLESPPSSAYTAAGYELCRISHDAFECTGPGRIMTLEYDNNLAVASIMQTPLSDWSVDPVTFSARRGLATQGLVDWIDTFIDSQRPDRLIIAGANTDHPSFVDALEYSRAASYLDHHSPLPPSYSGSRSCAGSEGGNGEPDRRLWGVGGVHRIEKKGRCDCRQLQTAEAIGLAGYGTGSWRTLVTTNRKHPYHGLPS